MSTDRIQYKYKEGSLALSEPNKLKPENLRSEEMIINLGPQHPSTHGVLRLEVLMDGDRKRCSAAHRVSAPLL
jgi:NADH-quinone oxidoreductase subunit D